MKQSDITGSLYLDTVVGLSKVNAGTSHGLS